MPQKLKKMSVVLVVFAVSVTPIEVVGAASFGAGDEQYFDPFQTGSKSSLAKKCKKKKYKNSKTCKKYRKSKKS